MRAPSIPAALALVLVAGCAGTPPLRPADPAQAVADDPAFGKVEVAGVTVVARAGPWRGWPDNLESSLTPLEIAVRNDSGDAIGIFPELFALVLPDGRRLTALDRGELKMRLEHMRGNPTQTQDRPKVGGRFTDPYDWPRVRGRGNPNPGVMHRGPDPRPAPEGNVASGDEATFLVFFDLPADKLKEFTLEANVADPDRVKLGTALIPFSREKLAQR